MEWIKNHKGLTAFLVICAFIGVSAIGAGEGTKQSLDNANKPSQNDKQPEQEQEVAKIGTPAKDGKFEFTVKSVACDIPEVGTNEYMMKKAQGQYCKLDMTVKNVGNEAQSIFTDNQILLNQSNQKFKADSLATAYATAGGNDVWINQINPGNSVDGAMYFDMPVGQKPTTAELHDSAFSGGVKVSLQ